MDDCVVCAIGAPVGVSHLGSNSEVSDDRLYTDSSRKTLSRHVLGRQAAYRAKARSASTYGFISGTGKRYFARSGNTQVSMRVSNGGVDRDKLPVNNVVVVVCCVVRYSGR